MISKITIKGYRGFAEEETLEIAIPNGENGSGLTLLVGPNNSGKTTLVESFNAFSASRGYQKPSFSEGKRNKKAGDRIDLKLYDDKTNYISISTVSEGGSEILISENELLCENLNIFVIHSRRTFNQFFSKNKFNRDTFLNNNAMPSQRGVNYDNFPYRLFNVLEKPEEFNKILSKIINPLPQWTIDMVDSGQYYVKFNFDGNYHSSEGAGEGLLSIFTIVDALYDSKPGNIIVIDEPELSLHPSFQKGLSDVISEFAKDRQIVVSTHSPYFIVWESLINGGTMARIVKEKGISKIHQLSDNEINCIKGLVNDLNNPHILGLDAKEVFFLNDNIIVVEGQEDVVFYKRLQKIIDKKLLGDFFGWGIGGATNVKRILKILRKLGFKKVTCVLDKDKEDLSNEMSSIYPDYFFKVIPAKDIRDKKKIKGKDEVSGLMDSSASKIKPEFKNETKKLFDEIIKYQKEQ